MSIDLLGFFTPWLIYTVVLAFHLVLPARRVAGYARNEATGNPCATD